MALADGTSLMVSGVQIDEQTGMWTVDPAMRHDAFYGDSDPAVTAELSARYRPMPFVDSWANPDVPAWRTIPSTYVRCTNDQAIPPALQAAMSARAADTRDWPCDHSPWLTRPGEIADRMASLTPARPPFSTHGDRNRDGCPAFRVLSPELVAIATSSTDKTRGGLCGTTVSPKRAVGSEAELALDARPPAPIIPEEAGSAGVLAGLVVVSSFFVGVSHRVCGAQRHKWKRFH
jgi:Alpha/beta hydrolase family